MLRRRLRDGSLNSILFPQDVVANAPRIISDLKRVFPPLDGHFLIGPMAKLGWGTPTLVTLELGLSSSRSRVRPSPSSACCG